MTGKVIQVIFLSGKTGFKLMANFTFNHLALAQKS